MGAGWNNHNGGPNPAPGKAVRVRFRDGGTNEGPSSAFLGWYHEPENGSDALRQDDIVGYAVIQPAGAAKGARSYTKTARWHAAKERRRTIPPSCKADVSDDTQPGTERSGVSQTILPQTEKGS